MGLFVCVWGFQGRAGVAALHSWGSIPDEQRAVQGEGGYEFCLAFCGKLACLPDNPEHIFSDVVSYEELHDENCGHDEERAVFCFPGWAHHPSSGQL